MISLFWATPKGKAILNKTTINAAKTIVINILIQVSDLF